jgi:hypothetical protein
VYRHFPVGYTICSSGAERYTTLISYAAGFERSIIRDADTNRCVQIRQGYVESGMADIEYKPDVTVREI